MVLVYLGFLHADEMAHRGRPFTSDREWRSEMLKHSAALVPDSAWDQRLETEGAPMWTTLRTMDLKWVVGG